MRERLHGAERLRALAHSHGERVSQRGRPKPARAASTALSLLLLLSVGAGFAGCATATTTAPAHPTAATVERAGTYVATNGTGFTYGGHALPLAGFTFYPALLGGAAAWSRPDFPHYIDQVVALGQMAGQNLLRPTNYWSATDKDQSWTNPTIWANIDYLLRTAQRHGMFVVLDLSAYRWFLTSQGLDPYDTANWTDFLRFVGARYLRSPAIAYYSVVGEPSVPTTTAATARLVDFYRTVTDELHAADQGHHLITAGGFIHMQDETPATPWWQDIFALPHNDVLAFKTYSQHDLDLLPTLAAEARRLGKPLAEEEFGMPQYAGDAVFSGRAYNDLRMSRAQFYATVYTDVARYGVTSAVFWNLGCQLSPTSFEVSPLTPSVWREVSQHGPAAHVPWPNATAPCQAS